MDPARRNSNPFALFQSCCNGPELFVPDQGGTVYPFEGSWEDYVRQEQARQQRAIDAASVRATMSAREDVPFADEWLRGNKFNEGAFDAWLASRPESENIDDRRGYDPTRPEGARSATLEEIRRGQLSLYERKERDRLAEQAHKRDLDENVDKWMEMIKKRDKEKKEARKGK
jgi:hypothetical protein